MNPSANTSNNLHERMTRTGVAGVQFNYTPARMGVPQGQWQLIGFTRCCELGGHRHHYIVAMGEQELAAFMGAEFMMGTGTGDWRLQHVQ